MIKRFLSARLCAPLLLTLCALGPWLPAAQAQDATEALQAAQAPGTHLLMRHALAPGVGDPADFSLADYGAQRDLSAAGRRQARRIGERLRAAGVKPDRVLTSRWCRCRDTAVLLGLGEVEDQPALNSFFRDTSTRQAQTAAALDLLRRLDAAGEKALLVTHQVRACLHYLCRSCCVPNCANQGTRSEIWSLQMSDKQRRVVQFGTQPEGPGCFAPRRRCQSLM